ncbi:MAG TPA: c-type cytochrome [Bryobacteraceae bacterium]|nr:c-type cytochrome [Bryobacteraceae bacterium]
MGPRWRLAPVAVLAIASATCSSGRHSPSAFHLPPDGDAKRGQAAFVALECNSCHEVSGVDLPRPTVQPPVPVALGGPVETSFSDAYLVTSIIYPSYDLAPYPKDEITSGGQSRMPHYADRMTVRQLTDIVAFLQSRYYVPRMPDAYR